MIYDKRKKQEDWHRWFAWHPVQLEDGRMAWLQYVQRRFVSGPDFHTRWTEYSLPSAFA